ncbi:MAG: hypothetical protein WBQ13_14860 [Terriglobales bacterium]
MGKPLTGMLAYIVAARDLRPPDVRAKCLLQYYCSNVNQHGTFFKSVLDIHMETALSPATIHRINAQWKVIGLLAWVEGNSFQKKANTYTVNLEILRKAAEASIKQYETDKAKVKQQSALRSRRYRAKRNKRHAVLESDAK